MAWQRAYGKHRNSNVKYNYFSSVHHDGCYVVGILLVPSNSDQRGLIITLVNDSGVFEISQVKVSDRAILSRRGKHADVLSKAYVIDSLIMGNKLSLDNFLFNVPDRASRVYA